MSNEIQIGLPMPMPDGTVVVTIDFPAGSAPRTSEAANQRTVIFQPISGELTVQTQVRAVVLLRNTVDEFYLLLLDNLPFRFHV